ncbi:hypothetical protein P154DRAFT_439146 [Amniculicola lignicola CBS 123094]|uniref:NACHT domain-containing protein n=1 Tax=Amniculicola lignicola CBS 123094 TaxID=1392246 RepID=A0A6A5WCE7_9PLEO|nr:hypothetical protein P154DRAFT_439146 [Amniculicola lignicola CBS 123094]
MTNVRTGLPFPTQPWEVAKARFLEGLSQEEVRRFKNATLENLFYDASATQKKHAKGSRTWVIQERITSLVDGIQDYGKALDVFSNTYPLVLCPLWGSIRVVLHIAQEAGKFQEKIVDMFARIGDVLPRFQIYEKLFRTHERLLAALSMAYLDILGFCISAKDFFLRAKDALLPISIACMGIWKPFRQQFDNYISEFRKHQKRVEKEAGLAHMIEFKRSQEIEIANLALQVRNRKIQKRHQILSSIPSIDYQLKHNKIAALRYPGTNTWIQQHPSYRKWLDTNSACLVCYGIPGSGKSVLAASIVEDLRASGERGTALCYYYCDYTDIESLDSSRLLATLIVQLLVQLPLDKFSESFNSPFGQSNYAPSITVMLEYMSTLLGTFQKIVIILDGLDELTQESQKSILDVISHFTQNTTRPTKILVTSRPEEYLLRNGLNQYIHLNLTTSLIQEDISLLVEETLRSSFLAESLTLSRGLKEHVKDCLVKGANGMQVQPKMSFVIRF